MAADDSKSVSKKRRDLALRLYQAGFRIVDIPEGCTARIEVVQPKNRQFQDPLLEVPIPESPDAKALFLDMMIEGDNISRLKRALLDVIYASSSDDISESLLDSCLRNFFVDDAELEDMIITTLIHAPNDKLRLSFKKMLKGDDIPGLKRVLSILTRINLRISINGIAEVAMNSCLKNLLVDDAELVDMIFSTLHHVPYDKLRSSLKSRSNKELDALLNSPKPQAREFATWLLLAVNPNPPLSTLKSIAADPNSLVRKCLAEELSRSEDENRIELLHDFVFDDCDDVRLAAIESLGKTGKELSLDLVSRLVTDQNKEIRLAALQNLFESVPLSKDVFNMLVALMHDPNEVRGNSIETFWRTFSTEKARFLQKEVVHLMEYSDKDIVSACARVLMWIGDSEHIELLARKYEKLGIDILKYAVWVLSGSYEKMEGAQGKVSIFHKGYYSPMIERAKEICMKRGRIDFTLKEIPKAAENISQLNVISENKKVFILKKHPLDAWLANLTEVIYKDLHSFVVNSWPFANSENLGDSTNPNSWTADHIGLARMLFRQDQEKISELFETISMSDFRDHGPWDEVYIDSFYKNEKEYKRAMAWREAWSSPLESLLKGTEKHVVEPSPLFSIQFYIEGAMSVWYWGWQAIALTEEFALVSQWDRPDLDGLHITPWIPTPLGVVTCDDIFRSTALLFTQCKTFESHDDRFGGEFDGENFWHDIELSGIDVPNLYRILMAHQGRGGDEILDMDERSLMEFKEDDMARDYADLMKIVRMR